MSFKLIALMVITACIVMQVQTAPSHSGQRVAVLVNDDGKEELRFFGFQGFRDTTLTNNTGIIRPKWFGKFRPFRCPNSQLVIPDETVIPTFPDVRYYNPSEDDIYDDDADVANDNNDDASEDNTALDAANDEVAPVPKRKPQTQNVKLQKRRRQPNKRNGYRKVYIIRS